MSHTDRVNPVMSGYFSVEISGSMVCQGADSGFPCSGSITGNACEWPGYWRRAAVLGLGLVLGVRVADDAR